jgi:hypothetical protein
VSEPSRLRDDPDWRRFLSSRLVSITGSSVTYVALPVVVYSMTSSPLAARLTWRALVTDVREGLRFLWGHATVRTMTIVGATQSLCGGAFVGLLVVRADRVLGTLSVPCSAGWWRPPRNWLANY